MISIFHNQHYLDILFMEERILGYFRAVGRQEDEERRCQRY